MHQSRHGEVFPQETSICTHHTRSLKFGVLKLRWPGKDRAQGALHCSRWASNSDKETVKITPEKCFRCMKGNIHSSKRASLRAASMNSPLQGQRN